MSNNSNYNNKRKGRPPQGGRKGKAAVDKSLLNDGVYVNARLTHVATSLIGCNVEVQVKNGGIYEGIFRTISPKMDIVLELAHKVDEANPTQPPTKDCLLDKVIFNMSDVVVLTAVGAELDFATKDAPKKDGATESFTDSAISKFNGQVAEKELQPWEADNPTEGASGELETDTPSAGGSANGWDAEDMFKENLSKFNVKSSYDPTLTAYTTPLDKQDTKEFKEREARAARIAQEIERSEGYKTRVDLENGDGDEEMLFSAVVRPDREGSGGGPGGKYIAPHLRKNVPQGRPAPNRGGPGKPGPQQSNKAATGPGQSPASLAVSEETNEDAQKNETNAGGVTEMEAVSSESNKSEKDATGTAATVAQPTSKAEVKKATKTQTIKDLKEFGSSFKLGSDKEKKPASETSSPAKAPSPSQAKPDQSQQGPPGAQQTGPGSSERNPDSAERKENMGAEALSEKVKKSTLNPNAREFTLNPTAKPFVPISIQRQQQQLPPMQVATPPRLTTQSPQGAYPGPLASMPPQSMFQPYVVPVSMPHQMVSAQQPRFNSATPGKRVTVSVQRPEFNPAAQAQAAAVQAATGQPLLAQNVPSVPGQPQYMHQYMTQPMVQQGGMPQVYHQMVQVPGHRMVTPPMVQSTHSANEPSQQGAPQTVFVPQHGGAQMAPQLGGPGVAGQQHHPHNPAHMAPHHQVTPPQSQPSHMATATAGQPGQSGPVGHPNPSPVPQGHPPAGHQQPVAHPPTSGTPQPHNVMMYQATPQMSQQGHPPLQPSPHTPTSPQTMYPLPYNFSHQGQQMQAIPHNQQPVSFGQVHPHTTVTHAQHHQHTHMPQFVMMHNPTAGHGQVQHGGHSAAPPQQFPPPHAHLQAHHPMQGLPHQAVPGQAGPTMVQASMNMSSSVHPQMYNMPPQMTSQGPPPMQSYPHSQ